VLIFANIASSLPSSVGALLAQNAESNPSNVAIYGVAFFLTTLGIIYVQEAERRIPVNYSSRCVAGVLLVLFCSTFLHWRVGCLLLPLPSDMAAM
jgi:preprotein translocase subunit SecY